MMALIHNDLPIIPDQRFNFSVSGYRLHHRNINIATGFTFTSPDNTNIVTDLQKHRETLLPLLQQFSPVYQYQCIHFPSGNHCRRGNCLTKSRWSTKYTSVITE